MTDYMGRTLKDALAYADQQREELPQIVQVVPSDYDRIIMSEEIARLQKLVETYNKIFTHNLVPDKGFYYFVCGEGGEKDQNNLPERIHICPAYGCDWFQIYERTDKTFGPEW